MSELKIFNEKPFYILVIEPGSIKELDWNNPNYIQSLISQPFVKTYEIEPDKFFNKIEEYLKIGTDGTNTHLMTEIISDEPNYNYEIIYVDTLNKKSNMEHNELASLIHLENEIIKGNCILIRNYIPTLSNDMLISDMNTSYLHKILRRRGMISVVAWEDSWREEEFYGDIENYADKFFEGEKYNKVEIAFLKHNLNIWYLESEYGVKNVVGNLINVPIEKCFIFTKLTNFIKGWITKDEVNKIIKLSTILEPTFKPDNKWFEDEKDETGRKIIKNKYRILDNVYQEYINKI
jgi:hypothetical protein